MQLDAKRIHERGVRAAKTYLASERELLDVLREQDAIRGYLEFEATSLYEYAHRILGLPEHTALDLINIARKSREVPELAEAVMAGEISATKARRIVPVITHENKSEWLELAATSSKRDIERAVKIEKPELSVQESARIVARDRVELKCGISEEVYDKLRRVMDLESQRLRTIANQEVAITAALDAYLEKYDPLLKAERARDRELRKLRLDDEPNESVVQYQAGDSAKSSVAFSNSLALKRNLGPGRVAIPSRMKRAILKRDGGRCTFRDSNGNRCSSRRWLEIHHLRPVSQGGLNTLENLVTLCSVHHRVEHSTVKEPYAAYSTSVA